jgi:A/G-specific adenine glycosylase
MREHRGAFPRRLDQVAALPGIGRSTAGAILVFSRGQRHAILDGNVKRVLARVFGIEGYPGDKRVADQLWHRAGRLLPRHGIAAYTQGLMDLGAILCTRARPRCELCPWAAACLARRKKAIARIPAARPRKALPQRSTVMLALTRGGEVLLEKRPPTGIWGGMWCLPQVSAAEGIDAHCLRRFGARIGRTESLPAIAHGFTHFRLDIRPLRLRVAAIDPAAGEPGLIWLPLAEARQAAIPAPVKRILAHLE